MIIKEDAFSKSILKKIKDAVFAENFPWFYSASTSYSDTQDAYSSSFAHMALQDEQKLSPIAELLETAILTALDNENQNVSKIFRIRIGLITAKHGDELVHTPHIDWAYPHRTGLIYLNDSDGPTVFYNELYAIDSKLSQKEHYDQVLKGKLTIKQLVYPKENKMVLFDGLQYHASTAPTSTQRRVVINFNYMIKENNMKASHILVDTKEQAESILAEATALNFGSLAQTHSKCPSKARGGDLGEFGPGQMVKPFEDATVATPVGSISQPVQTQFGYHLIHRTG